MKILFLTPELPYPPDRGASIRTFNLIGHLAERHEIHLLSFSREEPRHLSPLSSLLHRLTTVPPPSRSLGQRLLALLFSSQPDMAQRFPSPRFEEELASRLKDSFDWVQVEALEMARYIPLVRRYADTKVLFDDINAEYLLQRRAFQADLRHPSRWLGALYSLIQSHRLSRYEAWACRQVDRVVVVSQADALALKKILPGLEPTVVPNGVDTAYYQPSSGAEGDTLVFTGKMDFRPNVDAILWFYEMVWPSVAESLPQARLLIVGRSPSSRLRPLARDQRVTLTGWVPDVRPYIAEARAYIVPLQVGGGTRLKVLEAMAMGKAIISTSLGCEGIECTAGLEIAIADDPQGFADRILELWHDPKRRRELGRAARKLVEKRYDWREIVPLLESVL